MCPAPSFDSYQLVINPVSYTSLYPNPPYSFEAGPRNHIIFYVLYLYTLMVGQGMFMFSWADLFEKLREYKAVGWDLLT